MYDDYIEYLPREIVAGDTLQFKLAVDDYLPDDGWTLKYALLNSDGKIDIVASASDGDYHVFDVAAATTVGYDPGEYSVRGYVTNEGGERHTIWRDGAVLILPDPITAEAQDERSTAKKIIDQIDAIMEARTALSRDKGEFTVDGQKVKYRSFDELLRARRFYVGIYEDEEDAKYGISPGPGMVKITFSGP